MKPSFDELMAQARHRVDNLDAVDGTRDREYSTIAAALECGLRRPDTGAAFDALVMLHDRLERDGVKVPPL